MRLMTCRAAAVNGDYWLSLCAGCWWMSPFYTLMRYLLLMLPLQTSSRHFNPLRTSVVDFQTVTSDRIENEVQSSAYPSFLSEPIPMLKLRCA